jgi:hypothetical protein
MEGFHSEIVARFPCVDARVASSLG